MLRGRLCHRRGNRRGDRRRAFRQHRRAGECFRCCRDRGGVRGSCRCRVPGPPGGDAASTPSRGRGAGEGGPAGAPRGAHAASGRRFPQHRGGDGICLPAAHLGHRPVPRGHRTGRKARGGYQRGERDEREQPRGGFRRRGGDRGLSEQDLRRCDLESRGVQELDGDRGPLPAGHRAGQPGHPDGRGLRAAGRRGDRRAQCGLGEDPGVRRQDPRHRRADEPARTQRLHRGGARGGARARFRRRRGRGRQASERE